MCQGSHGLVEVGIEFQAMFELSRGRVPFLLAQSGLSQHERNDVHLWISFLDLRQQLLASLKIVNIKSVRSFENGIEFPQLVLWIRQSTGECGGRNWGTIGDIAKGTEFLDGVGA